MRIVMFGYQTWGHRTLQALLESGHDVVMALTHPASDHAYEKIWSDSVADLAAENGVEVMLKNRPDEEVSLRLKELEPDLIVANNWRTYIPSSIFNLPTHGTLNVHDSLLPKYAGFSPLIWAMINGDTEVGLTAHMMDEELDMGPIVLQRSIPVGPRDTVTDLFHRTVDLITPVVHESLDLIASGKAELTPQDRSQASFFHKRSLEDSRIDWTWPAETLDRLIRAQSDPYPNAFTFNKSERIRITKASVSRGCYGGTPGRIFIKEDDGIVIVAGSEARNGTLKGLRIERLRLDDGTEIAATDYFRTMGGYLTRDAR